MKAKTVLENTLEEPSSWKSAFRQSRPLARTSMFWTCALALVLAVANTTGVAVHILLIDKGQATLLMAGFAVLDGYSLWLGLRVFKAAQRIQQLSTNAEREALSDLGALLAKTFMFAMIALASGAMAALIILGRH